MVDSRPSSVAAFIDGLPASAKTLLLVNRTGPKQLAEMLDRAFADQSVTVAEREIPEGPTDVVCLIDDGDVVAMTPFARLKEAFLLVNADRYRTGTRQLTSGSFPDVLTGLDEIQFTVRGFPVSNQEKLLLVVISRFIESRALRQATGELHTTFQQLSRLDDEYGTRTVYEWLAETDVDTHIYGVDDDPAAAEQLDVTVHAGNDEEYRNFWIVSYSPPEEESAATTNGHVALVAEEMDQNVWRGTWTYDPVRVTRLQSYMREEF